MDPSRVWTMWTLMVSLDSRWYLDALEYMRPGKISNFPALMDASHINLTGDPAAACRYLTSASTLGRSYTM